MSVKNVACEKWVQMLNVGDYWAKELVIMVLTISSPVNPRSTDTGNKTSVSHLDYSFHTVKGTYCSALSAY